MYDLKTSLTELADGRELIACGANFAFLATQATSDIRFQRLVDDECPIAIGGHTVEPPDSVTALGPEKAFAVVFGYKPWLLKPWYTLLESAGFVHGKDFVDCSHLHYQSISRRLKEQFGIESSPTLFTASRLAAFSTDLQNLSGFTGSWLFLELLHSTSSEHGAAIAECGTYKGGNAASSFLLSSDFRTSSVFLLDTFNGFPAIGEQDPASRAEDFRDSDEKAVRALFAGADNMRVCAGNFVDTLPALRDQSFRIVYIDCDLAKPAEQCCEFFGPRLQEDGLILVHDYWAPDSPLPPGYKEPFRGVRPAIDDFAKRRGMTVTVFPETSHAVVRLKQ